MLRMAGVSQPVVSEEMCSRRVQITLGAIIYRARKCICLCQHVSTLAHCCTSDLCDLGLGGGAAVTTLGACVMRRWRCQPRCECVLDDRLWIVRRTAFFTFFFKKKMVLFVCFQLCPRLHIHLRFAVDQETAPTPKTDCCWSQTSDVAVLACR